MNLCILCSVDVIHRNAVQFWFENLSMEDTIFFLKQRNATQSCNTYIETTSFYAFFVRSMENGFSVINTRAKKNLSDGSYNNRTINGWSSIKLQLRISMRRIVRDKVELFKLNIVYCLLKSFCFVIININYNKMLKMFLSQYFYNIFCNYNKLASFYYILSRIIHPEAIPRVACSFPFLLHFLRSSIVHLISNVLFADNPGLIIIHWNHLIARLLSRFLFAVWKVRRSIFRIERGLKTFIGIFNVAEVIRRGQTTLCGKSKGSLNAESVVRHKGKEGCISVYLLCFGPFMKRGVDDLLR